MNKLIDKIQGILSRREVAALCTVIETKGSTPLKAGAKMIVWSSGKIFGTIGGGELEKQVIQRAQEMVHDGGMTDVAEFNLVKDLGMCCGGTVRVFIELVALPHQLYIFGGGHVGAALARNASLLDFKITLVDDRKEVFQQMDIPGVHYLHQHPVESVAALKWDKNTFAVIMTYNHPLDRQILSACIRQPAGYIGMIGSRRKAAVTRKLFKEQGIADEAVMDKVDMPIGLDIQAETPEEIAVSILARLIREKNKWKQTRKAPKLMGEEAACNEIIKIARNLQ